MVKPPKRVTHRGDRIGEDPPYGPPTRAAAIHDVRRAQLLARLHRIADGVAAAVVKHLHRHGYQVKIDAGVREDLNGTDVVGEIRIRVRHPLKSAQP